MEVLGAYIIYVPKIPISVKLAKRCFSSCENVGQKSFLYEGFDGTTKNIIVPENLKNQSWIKWMKVTDHFQSLSEIACSLSHISLWIKCMEEDRPIIILEHDAIMLKPYVKHSFYNTISYLGCREQYKNDVSINQQIYSSINKNWNFIHRAHAYCIDPPAAKRLFLNVLDRGIYESADVMIKCDDVAIIQQDLYAYDSPENVTTIKHKENHDNRKLKEV